MIRFRQSLAAAVLAAFTAGAVSIAASPVPAHAQGKQDDAKMKAAEKKKMAADKKAEADKKKAGAKDNGKKMGMDKGEKTGLKKKTN